MSWRVWAKEWVSVHTSDHDGEMGALECSAHFKKNYEGRVKDADWRVLTVSESWPATLQLSLFNVRGEFRDDIDSLGYYDALVERYGRAFVDRTELGDSRDKELETYGKKMLPT